METGFLSVVLAIGALLVGSLVDVLYRVGQKRGLNAGTLLFLQSYTFTGLIWAGAAATGQIDKIMAGTWKWGLMSGVLSYSGLYLFIRSLRHGDASVHAPIFRLNFVVAAIGGIFLLHETANPVKVGGILLAVVAVVSLVNLRSLFKGGTGRQPLLTVIAAALLFGGVGIVAKQALNGGSGAVPFILTQTVAFQTGATLCVVLTRSWRPDWKTVRFALPIGVLQLAWSILLFQSLALGDASVTYPIVQLSFVLTAVMAVAFLGEATSHGKVAGLALAVMAVAALAFA